MTYVVRVWEKPVDWPAPSGFDEAQEQLDRLDAMPETPSAKLALLAGRLMRAFPQGPGATWTDDPLDDHPSGPVWNIGIASRDQLDGVQAFLVTQATAIGLNVLDEQAGELHLGNGGVHSVNGTVRTDCLRGMAAAAAGDFADARAEFRRLGAKGNVYAQLQWAQMFLTGRGERRDLATGCAIACFAQGWRVDASGALQPPADPGPRASGEALRRRVGAQAVIHADRILGRSPTLAELMRRIDDMQSFFKEVDPQVRQAAEKLADGATSATVRMPLPSTDRGRARAAAPARTPARADDAGGRVPFMDGPWALIAALVPALWIFTFPDSKRVYEFLWLSSGLLGAWGVWRTGTLLAWSPVRRGLFVAGVLCPVTSALMLITAIWAWTTQRRS